MPHFFRNTLTSLLLLLCASAPALTVKDIANALDNPAGVTFSAPKGDMGTEKKFSDSYLLGEVIPVGGTMLKLKAGSKKNKELRTDRSSASFTFTVKGAGTLTFNYTACVRGYYDDCLVFFENDIDDTIEELSGDVWYKEDEKEYYDYAEDYWNEDELTFGTEKYTHTVTVVQLCEYDEPDFYEKPESYEVVKNFSMLDNFVWTPDDSVTVCELISDHPDTPFGAEGIKIAILSDYRSEDGDLVLEYWYTTDGSVPQRGSSRSTKYDESTPIAIPGTVAPGAVKVCVAAYEGAEKIGDYSAEYTRRPDIGAPSVASATFDEAKNAISLTLAGVPETESFIYFYTTDGSDPTTDSTRAEGNAITIDTPATLKVLPTTVAGEIGKKFLTVPVVQAQKPGLEITADGIPTGNTLFAEQCAVSASTQDGRTISYRSKGGALAPYTGPVAVSTTQTLEFLAAGKADAAGGTYQLQSPAAAITLTREQPAADGGAWATDQTEAMTESHWYLFKVTRKLSDKTAAAIAQWLQPFAYNSVQQCMEKASALVPGTCCLVHPAMMKNTLKPASFTDGGQAESLPAEDAWILRADKADFTWDGTRWNRTTPPANAPGWGK